MIQRAVRRALYEELRPLVEFCDVGLPWPIPTEVVEALPVIMVDFRKTRGCRFASSLPPSGCCGLPTLKIVNRERKRSASQVPFTRVHADEMAELLLMSSSGLMYE